ncbi:MAG: PLP-dependent aminotransferase family protein [Dongiaceae bacterium]
MIRAAAVSPAPVHVDRTAAEPLHRQVYRDLVQLILSGRLRPGARVPSSRTLAAELGIARNTALLALEQAASEGYLEARHGSGTYVSSELPDVPPVAFHGRVAPGGRQPRLSTRARSLLALTNQPLATPGLLRPGEPDCTDFPFGMWARLMAEGWRAPDRGILLGDGGAGHARLREAISDYLAAARGVGSTAGQTVIVSGIRQALAVVARLLLDPGDVVWLENPGYPGLRGPLVATGAKLAAVEVDGEGLSLRAGRRLAPRPKLICVAPSHQYPLGMTMSVARRLALLDYARQVNAWIFEDDYDSEWRYSGRPLAAMQGLDRDGRVLYAGTFSKILFPSIRLGYIVLPPQLVAPFLAARRALDDQPAVLAQPALAEFIAGGHLAAHLRRQRRRYKAKQERMLAAADRHLRGLLEVAADAGGMHLVGYLQDDLARRMSDVEASRRAAAAGIAAPPLSDHWIGRPRRQGLLLGYTAPPERQIDAIVARLARALVDRDGGSSGWQESGRASRSHAVRRIALP